MRAPRGGAITGVPHSVTKALKLLRLFGENGSGLGLTEVAVLAGLPKGTAHRLLIALEEEGFVIQHPESRKWGLGFGVVQLYHTFRGQVSLFHVATPWMRRLRDEVQETICLVVEDSGFGVCIERLDPDRELLFQTAMGARVPLHSGATRKLLMAFLPEDRSEAIIREIGLPPVTSRTITDPDRLREDLAQIRRQGYAVSEGEHNLGVAAVAAPLRDATGKVVASLSVAGPSQRLTAEQIQRVLPRLMDTAQQISRQLGYRESSIAASRGGSK